MPKNSQLLIDIGQGLTMRVGLPRISTWETKDRPVKASPGTFGFNTQTNQLEYWDGSAWYSAEMN